MSDTPKKRGRPKGSKNRIKAVSTPVRAGRKQSTGTIAAVIREGLLAGKTTDAVLQTIKQRFPEAKTTRATIHNYRSALRKERVELTTPSRAKKNKKRNPAKRTITKVIEEALLVGKTNDETLDQVRQEFPDAKTTRNTVVIQRSKLRKAGKSIPSSWEAKKLAKVAQAPVMQVSTGVKASPQMTIAIASDHAGLELKTALKKILKAQGITPLDLGTNNGDSVDYPDFATAVAQAMAWGHASRGIVICGSGIGISIAINRHRHVRAALCTNGLMARLARQHNDANVLALGSRVTGEDVAKDCLNQFLNTQFEGGRHSRRIDKMS